MSADQSDSQATSEVVSPDEALEYLSSVFRDPNQWARERNKIHAAQGVLVYWQGRMQSQVHEALVTILSALMGQYVAAQEAMEASMQMQSAAAPDPHVNPGASTAEQGITSHHPDAAGYALYIEPDAE